MRRAMFAAALPLALLVLVAAAYTPLMRRHESKAYNPDVQSPEAWVAFSAAWEKTGRDGPAITGRFFRDSDGSTREEADLDGRLVRISLVNIPRNAYFERSSEGTWCSHPMRLPERGYNPPKIRAEQLVAGQGPIEGYAVFAFNSGSKAVNQLVSPSLNFFPLLISSPTNPTRMSYSRIQVGPQDSSLFLPPDGVQVALHTGYRGGVIHRKEGDPPLKIKDIDNHR